LYITHKAYARYERRPIKAAAYDSRLVGDGKWETLS
jgi:hypothetical protein